MREDLSSPARVTPRTAWCSSCVVRDDVRSSVMQDAPLIFDSHAADYNAARRRLVPPFDSFYGTAVAAVRLAGPSPARILDLGAGTGLLSAMLRSAFPDTHLTLLDAAPQMLAQARIALGEKRVTYDERDLSDPIPTGPWDAIVSALAIHHLDNPEKQRLIKRIHGELGPGGVFVNAEQVAGPSSLLDRVYADWHESSARRAGSEESEWNAAVARMRHDQCATVEDQLAWLRRAGFTHADCLFKDHRFAVLVALR